MTPTGPNGNMHGQEYWSQFEPFRPYYFALAQSLYLALNGAYFLVQKAEEVRSNYTGGEIRPFLKDKELKMLEWLGRMHWTSPFCLLRGNLAFVTSNFWIIYVVAGSADPVVNGLWGSREKSIEALAGQERGHYRNFFQVHDNMRILAHATSYVQRYGLMLNLAIAS